MGTVARAEATTLNSQIIGNAINVATRCSDSQGP
jgi:hypothetical protein